MSHQGRLFQQDLWEIEEVLSIPPSVYQATVVLREDELIAYVVPHANVELNVDELMADLSLSLPDHKIPTRIIVLEALPIAPSGRIDSEALMSREFGRQKYAEPVGDIEAALALIWCDILGVEKVGRNDDVFQLGGYSLQAINIVTAISKRFGCKFRLRHVFEYPDLLSMSAQISNLLVDELAMQKK